MAEDAPINSLKDWFMSELNCSWRCLRLAASSLVLRRLQAADTVTRSFSFCHGLSTKSVAPFFTAVTARFISPKAVIMITTAVGSISMTFESQSNPSCPLVTSLE